MFGSAALAQERAFVEVTAPKSEVHAGERINLTLRFGYDRDFFRDHAVPLFAREMDVPVQIQARLPGAPAAGQAGPRFALNEGVARAASAAEETRAGRVFSVFALSYDHTPRDAGDAVIEAPALRYAYATRFEEDFVSGRVAKDPRQEVVWGAAVVLRVRPLPEEGRPPEFQGAVGRFTVRAEASRTSLAEGETLRLSLDIEGDGNAKAPDLRLPGFHVLGTIHRAPHSATYDLRPLGADVREIPPIAFAFFDPGPPAGYRVVSTDPIPLEVRPAAAPEPPSPPPARTRAPSWIFVVIAALGVASAILALRVRARRRTIAPDPEAVRVRAALAALRERVGRPAPELADALAEFLATYLACPSAAVIGPDLPARLVARGLAPGLAARASTTLEGLVAARYGGGLGGGDELRALLPELEAAIAGGGSPP